MNAKGGTEQETSETGCKGNSNQWRLMLGLYRTDQEICLGPLCVRLRSSGLARVVYRSPRKPSKSGIKKKKYWVAQNTLAALTVLYTITSPSKARFRMQRLHSFIIVRNHLVHNQCTPEQLLFHLHLLAALGCAFFCIHLHLFHVLLHTICSDLNLVLGAVTPAARSVVINRFRDSSRPSPHEQGARPPRAERRTRANNAEPGTNKHEH